MPQTGSSPRGSGQTHRVQRCAAGRGAPQRGAALLTALLIVTLIASLAAGMVWQQYRAVQIEAAERARAQSGWILQGALDWARLILKEDLRADQSRPPAKDHLGEPWAVPLAEARLSTFLAAGGGNAGDDGPEAFLSGVIEDAQGRYNLRAVTAGTQVPAPEQLTLELLCRQVDAPPGTATLIITGLRAAFPTAASGASAPASGLAVGGSNAPLAPAGVDQLRWLGLDAATLQRLEPYVVLLPRPTPVNLNTAPREVIAALLNTDLATAERIVQGRKGRPLQTLADAAAYLSSGTQIAAGRASVDSSFYLVTGRLRLDERVLTQRSLIERQGNTTTVIARERVSQLLER